MFFNKIFIGGRMSICFVEHIYNIFVMKIYDKIEIMFDCRIFNDIIFRIYVCNNINRN